MWLLPNRYRSSSEILTTSHSDSDAAPLAELTPQLEDGYGIKVLHDPQQPVVDIVFVHGLTGGQVSTWAAEGAAQPWPQSFLAKDIPTARISAFGYDADVVKVFGQAGQNKLRQHASNLVACVADLQFESKSAPPIIFVAHSLGGLVCENMLTIASSGEQHWREVLESTIAIAFLGTPHRGSDSASWAKIAGNLVNVARRTNTSILGVLEPDSEVLENVTNDFHNLRRSREDDGKKKVQITCYGEEKAMEMGGKSVLVVPTQSASLDGCTFVTLSGCDHSSMTKFGTKNSEYGKVRTQIKRWIQAMTPAPDKPLTQDQRRCLQAFLTSDYKSYLGRNRDRIPGTCLWFLNNENYQKWYKDQSSSLLLVTADPGCGKSVLAYSLINRELKSSPTRTTCYFFFKDDDEKQKSAINALSALLHQLFSQKRSLLPLAMQDFESTGAKLTESFDDLWKVLTRVANDPEAGEIVCVLDALDECEESGRLQIIEALNEFYLHYTRPEEHPTKLKFLATTRPYYHIERPFATLTDAMPSVRLKGEEESAVISEEINHVIKSRVHGDIGQKLGLDYSERLALEKDLLEIPHRTYLWITLIFEVILGSLSVTKRKLEDIIKTVPGTVEKAYEEILKKSVDQDQTRKLLCIVLAAKRPLTLKEMKIALAIRDEHRSYEELDLETDPRFRITIRNLCGLFVSVVDNKIYLIHQTAKEFLVASNAVLDNGWKHSITPIESELFIARTCMTYLLFDELYDKPFETEKVPMRLYHDDKWYDEFKDMAAGYINQHGYLGYASQFWAVHWKIAQVDAHKTPALLNSAIKLCNTRDGRGRTWYQFYRTSLQVMDKSPNASSMITVASYLGHETTVAELLKLGKREVNVKADFYGRNALRWATQEGHEAVVKLLLERDEIVYSKDDLQTTLFWAAESQHEAIVRILLKRDDIDPNSKKYRSRWTPLHWAVKNGQESLVELLIGRNDINADVKDSKGQTPLLIAAQRGNKAMVKLLLKRNDLEVDSKDLLDRTPLAWAASEGYPTIVKLFLERDDVNPNSKDQSNKTPLSLAAEARVWFNKRPSHQEVVKLLVECDKVDSTSKLQVLLPAAENGWASSMKLLLKQDEISPASKNQALLKAAENGREGIVKLLVEQDDVDINSKDGVGKTPLSWAAKKGRTEVVRLLLTESGININSKDGAGKTPLSWAAEEGHTEVARLLLTESGININSKDGAGKTPLSWAAEEGHTEVVRLLLTKSGIDINSKDDAGNTPLSWAVWNRHTELVRLLLTESGIDINSKDDAGKTPLSWTAENGHTEVAELLLRESGIDINSKDNAGKTPLSWAVGNRHTELVRLLLTESGIDINSKDRAGKTPLSWAAEKGYTEAVRLLLTKSGIDLNSKDGAGKTPLSWTAENGHTEVAELLLRESKISINFKDEAGSTPLSLAAKNGHPEVVRLLHKNGNIDPNSTDNDDGLTPLSWAARNGHTEVVRLLLERGNVKTNLKDRKGETAGSWAHKNGHTEVMHLLESHVQELSSEVPPSQVQFNDASNEDGPDMSWWEEDEDTSFEGDESGSADSDGEGDEEVNDEHTG